MVHEVEMEKYDMSALDSELGGQLDCKVRFELDTEKSVRKFQCHY